MAKQRLLVAVAANGNGPTIGRSTSRVVQNKFMWQKTGAGTATINLVDAQTGVVLATDAIAANAQQATHDLFGSDAVFAQLASVVGVVAVDAWLDGWD